MYVQTAAALAALGDPELVDCALAHLVARHAHMASPTEADVIDTLRIVVAIPQKVLAVYGLP